MYKLLQVPLREYVRNMSVPYLSAMKGLHRSSSYLPPVPCCEFGSRNGHKELYHIQNTRRNSRIYSTGIGERGAAREPVRTRIPDTYTSIDPEKEEEFVFLDHSEPDKCTQEDTLRHELKTHTAPVLPKDDGTSVRSGADKRQRSLEQQLRSLQTVSKEDVELNALIEFHDVGYPIEERKTKKSKGQQKIYGTPDVEEPVSETSCSGCGAVMHCTDPDVAGYLPSEKYKSLLEEDKLNISICQRCYLLTHHQKALTIKMSKEEYRNIVRGIKSQKALVLLIVDLLDIPDSIIPDLLDLVGNNKNIVVLGNKIDLIPGDSDNYMQRIKRQLSQYCTDAGISVHDNVKDIHLISAKTGYGIENLISSLQKSWKYKGDVYLVGTANAGKSTLFNTLLESDYCKSKATDVIHKATISPWPGTTLNLLKFPIINPTPYRMFKRSERLKMASEQTEKELSPQEVKRLTQFSKQGYLVGRIGRTFRVEAGKNKGVVEFDPDSLAYGEGGGEEEEKEGNRELSAQPELTHNELKDAHWLHDTPGIMKDHDILNLLTEQEVKMVVPTQAIVPRTFLLKPGMVLFLGAVGRIDYLQGAESCWLSVIASAKLPVHITSLDRADSIYQKHAGQILLGVPMGGEERMKAFPRLVCQEFELKGLGHYKAIADIKMSSAGWVAVTGVEGSQVVLRAHTPEGSGLSLRSPPLLPHVVTIRGERINKSPAYKLRKPPALVDSCISYKGADRLNVKKRKSS